MLYRFGDNYKKELVRGVDRTDCLEFMQHLYSLGMKLTRSTTASESCTVAQIEQNHGAPAGGIKTSLVMNLRVHY